MKLIVLDRLVAIRDSPAIRQVLEIIAAVKEEDPQELAEKIYENTEKIFFS